MSRNNKKAELDAAKNHLDYCSKNLKVHEVLWQQIWEAQQNPFLRIKEYLSEQQVSKRKPIIDQWLDAKKKYQEIEKNHPVLLRKEK
jgi:acyl carrier protein phosphodiesterase